MREIVCLLLSSIAFKLSLETFSKDLQPTPKLIFSYIWPSNFLFFANVSKAVFSWDSCLFFTGMLSPFSLPTMGGPIQEGKTCPPPAFN